MPNTGISGTNNNKTMNVRGESLRFLILTNSVTETSEKAVLALYNNGNSRSVHYLINKSGHQDQFANENEQTFTNGKSQFLNKFSLNKSAVNVMLINNGNEAYPKEQKDKLMAFLSDFRKRNSEIDLKINLLGLGEVAIKELNVPEGEGKIFPRHEAPGKIFWAELAEELANQGFGLFIPTTPEEKAEICVSSASQPEDITELQNNLRAYGYAIEKSGKYDDATKAWVTRFNQRYVPDAVLSDNLWSRASQKSLEYILNYINAKTNTVTQSPNSSNSFFNLSNVPAINSIATTQQQTEVLSIK